MPEIQRLLEEQRTIAYSIEYWLRHPIGPGDPPPAALTDLTKMFQSVNEILLASHTDNPAVARSVTAEAGKALIASANRFISAASVHEKAAA